MQEFDFAPFKLGGTPPRLATQGPLPMPQSRNWLRSLLDPKPAAALSQLKISNHATRISRMGAHLRCNQSELLGRPLKLGIRNLDLYGSTPCEQHAMACSGLAYR